MKFYISVNLEGVACIVGKRGKVLKESPDYQFACRQALRETNAAIRALFDSGATQVLVRDGFEGSLNLNYMELDERCDIVAGATFGHRLPALDNTFDGVLFIGYHPMDNTMDGVLAYTVNMNNYQWIKVNGSEIGDIAIDAALADDLGNVPVIFVSSDDKGTAEARKFMPWVETVAVKRGLSNHAAISKSPGQAAREIYEGVKSAVLRIGEMSTFNFSSPLTVHQRFRFMDLTNRSHRLIDPYTIERIVDKISEIY